MSGKRLLALAALMLPMGAAQLKPETVQAWEQYVRSEEMNVEERLRTGRPFLWADEQADRLERLKQGEILVAPLLNGRGYAGVPNGLIHHWVGAAFLPNTSAREVLATARSYAEYADVYGPPVVAAKLIRRDGDRDHFSVLTVHKVLFVTAAVETEYESVTGRPDARRVYTITNSTRIQDIQNYGRNDESKLPPDGGNGYVWRLSTIARYEERDGGVYVEIEALGLSRDIPVAFRSLVRPIVAKLSRDSLLVTLRQTRDACIRPESAAIRSSRKMPGQSFAPQR